MLRQYLNTHGLHRSVRPGQGSQYDSTTSVQCKPPCVWTDTVQGRRSTVWSRRLALPYGIEGGQFVLQFDLSTAVQGLPRKSIYSLGLLCERSPFSSCKRLY